MTDIPKPLAELRDGLAREHAINERPLMAGQYGYSAPSDFKDGFNAAIEHLSKPVEFDEKAMHAFMSRCLEDRAGFTFDQERGIEIGARFQFESDRARIGLAEHDRDVLKNKCSVRDETIEQLEARLSELQVKYYERGMAMRETANSVRSLYESKLAACELKLIQTTHQNERLRETSKLNRALAAEEKLDAAEARIKILEGR